MSKKANDFGCQLGVFLGGCRRRPIRPEPILDRDPDSLIELNVKQITSPPHNLNNIQFEINEATGTHSEKKKKKKEGFARISQLRVIPGI